MTCCRRPLHLALLVLAPPFLVIGTLGVLRVESGDACEPRPRGLVGQSAELVEGNRLLQGQRSPFVPNLGQWRHAAHFVHRSSGVTMFLEERGWVLDLVQPPRERHGNPQDRIPPRGSIPAEEPPARAVSIRMTFEASQSNPEIEGEDALPGVHNYFLGNDPDRWRTHVPLYTSVLYRSLYAGVDMRVRTANGHPEYDLLVGRGVDLDGVSVRVHGARSLHTSRDGSLVIETELGPLTQPVPVTWEQSPCGEKRKVACNYVVLGPDRFGFEANSRDTELPLTIDPGLLWSTYLGGSLFDAVRAISVEPNGVLTAAGGTMSVDFPATPGAYDTSHNADDDVFVSRLDPSQTGSAQLVYATFLGGTGGDAAAAVSLDEDGVVTVAGTTRSSTYPTTAGAYDTTFNGSGPSPASDAFVSRLDPNKSGPAQLVYSTFLGGSDWDAPSGVSVDADGVVTVAGETYSPSFPTTPSAYAATYNGGTIDAFVSQLDLAQQGSAQLVYSTFLGGNSVDQISGISVDAAGVVTVTGSSSSADYPTTAEAYAATLNGGGSLLHFDGFVSRLDPSLEGHAQLVYSTFLGGGNTDYANALAVTADGLVTVTGSTLSADFPTTAAVYDTTFNGAGIFGPDFDTFVSKLDPSQSGAAQLVYSTFLGGSSGNTARAVSVDGSGVVTVAGYTSSVDFPTTPGACNTTYGPQLDGYVSRLDPNRTGSAQLTYSTFLGGSGLDWAQALSVDATGAATVAGFTSSPGYPTTPDAYDPTGNAGPNSYDGFVTRLDMHPTGAAAYGASSPGCVGPLAMSVTSWPQAENTDFSLTCNNAPALTSGGLLLGTSGLGTPLSFQGANLWVDPAGLWFALIPTLSNGGGGADVALPLPPGSAGAQFYAQFLWFGPSSPPPCPVTGFSASNALAITIQP